MTIFLYLIAALAVLIALGALARHFAEARERRSSTPPGELIDIGGRRLHLLRRGNGGPTVVIESGGAFSSAMWWPFQDALAATATVVCYDRAGLGWSDDAPLPRTIEDRVSDLEMLLSKAGLAPPYVLVGLSYGGPLIRVFAQRHPEQVAGLVFIDIAHEAVFTTPGAQKYVQRCVTALKVLGSVARIGLPRLLRMRGLIQDDTALPYSDDQLRALTSRYPTANSFFTGADEFASMLHIGDAMRGCDTAGLLGSVPIVVISHGMSFPGPFAVLETNHMAGQQALAALSSNSELIIAQQSSHAVPVQEPQLVLDAIRRVVLAARDHVPLASVN